MNETEWKWTKDAQCYYIADNGQPPHCYCLGDRYVYADYGKDSYGILYRGSTIDNWGGYNFGTDLKKALEWVSEDRYTGNGNGYTFWCRSGINPKSLDMSLVDNYYCEECGRTMAAPNGCHHQEYTYQHTIPFFAELNMVDVSDTKPTPKITRFNANLHRKRI